MTVGSELVTLEHAENLDSKREYAKALAVSPLLPDAYRNNPGNLLYAIEYAEMLGLPPMVAITGIHVIKGKPSASGALISALIRKAGHVLRVHGDGKSATCQIVRSDDPENPFVVTWTIEQAQLAGLLSNESWKKYPRSMLKWRAVTECARDACPEALFGILYTPEELGAEVTADGVAVVTSTPLRRRATPRTIVEAVRPHEEPPTVTVERDDEPPGWEPEP